MAIDDGFLPMHVEDLEKLNVMRDKRQQYWSALRLAREEYMQEHKGVYDLTARPTLHYWVEEKYGLRMEMDGQGNYTQSFTIVDPKRYLIFQLKFIK